MRNQSSLPACSPAVFMRTSRSDSGDPIQECEKLMNCEKKTVIILN